MKRRYPLWFRLLLLISLLNLASAGYAMDADMAEKCAQHCQTTEVSADIQHDMQHDSDKSDCSETMLCGLCGHCVLSPPLVSHRYDSLLSLLSHITMESTFLLTGVIPPLHEHPPRASV